MKFTPDSDIDLICRVNGIVRPVKVPSMSVTEHFSVHKSHDKKITGKYLVTHNLSGYSLSPDQGYSLGRAIEKARSFQTVPANWNFSDPKLLIADMSLETRNKISDIARSF